MVNKIEKSDFSIRLAEARKNARYTRPALAEATGIPEKTLEKYEYDMMEPNISRLNILANTLEVSTNYLLHGYDHDSGEVSHDNVEVLPDEVALGAEEGEDTTAESARSASDSSYSAMEHCEVLEAPDGDHCEKPHSFVSKVYEQLTLIDTLRKDGFENHQRKTPEIIVDISRALACLELDELDQVAEARGVEDYRNLSEINFTNIDDLTAQAKELAERIVDTAILSKDLHEEDYEDLKRFANKNDVEHGRVLSHWRGYEELVPAVRPVYRQKALSGDLRQKTSIL